ncbi:hypothetical protein [Enterococcus casseliflavus]|nr:hypothetical protein [Enterococcus casseliflavus]
MKKTNTLLINFLKEKNSMAMQVFNSLILSVVTNHSNLSQSSIVKSKLKILMFPKNISQISSKKIGIIQSLDDTSIINLVSFYFKIFNEELNLFIALKEKYECFFYNEEYENALGVLDEIEQKICTSLWGVKQKLVINDLLGGLEKNKLYLEKITNQTEGKVFLDVIFNSYSVMSEKQTSYENYQNYIDKFIGNSKGSVFSYFRYKLDLEYEVDKSSFSDLIQIETFLSIIDLYLSFSELYPKYLYLSNSISIPKVIANSLRNINDYRNQNLLVKFGENSNYEDKLFLDDRNQEYAKIIDNYSLGDYDSVNFYMSKYLMNNISDFQSITIYVKSLIQNNENYSGESDVIKSIYSMYAIDDDYFESKQRMYKYRKMYKGTGWESKIISFLERRESAASTMNVRVFDSYLNDHKLTPNFTEVIFDQNIRKNFSEKMNTFYPITNDIVNNNNTSIIKDDFRRKYMELVNRKVTDEEWDKHLESMIFEKSFTLFSRERVAVKFAQELARKKNYHKFINLVVKTFLENELLINRINLQEIFHKIRRRTPINIKESIDYPIFVFLCDRNNKRNKNTAVANFLESNNIHSIDRLLDSDFEGKRKNFLLSEILDIYTIKKDNRFLNETDDAEKIRLKILDWLIVADEKNKKKYIDEINSINKQTALKDRINRINKSKIFVDTQRIFEENKRLWEEDYSNYLDSRKFEQQIFNSDIEIFKELSDLEYFEKINLDMKKKLETDATYHQELLMLKILLNKILDELLTNTTHGLETYLSSRIRHGYTKNHLTNLFYKYYLMSKSDNLDSDDYLVNEHWDNKPNYSPEQFELFKHYISRFTSNIDSVSKQITSEWLQIKRTKKDTGLFDYIEVVDIAIVGLKDSKFSNFKELFDQFLEYFWSYTEKNLKNIRSKVNFELKKFFYEQLDELEQKISSIPINGMEKIIPECLTNIKSCRAGVESTITDFLEVFEKPNISHKNFNMTELCETVLSISEKMYRDFDKIDINQNIQVTDSMEGSYFPYFIDSLDILFNNAIEHSGLSDLSDLKLTIDIKKIVSTEKEWFEYRSIFKSKNINIRESEEFNYIEISNNLDDQIDINHIYDAFKSAEAFDKSKKFIQTEGGSGLIKLFNIFKNSLPVPYMIMMSVEDQVFKIKIIFSNYNLLVKGVI